MLVVRLEHRAPARAAAWCARYRSTSASPWSQFGRSTAYREMVVSFAPVTSRTRHALATASVSRVPRAPVPGTRRIPSLNVSGQRANSGGACHDREKQPRRRSSRGWNPSGCPPTGYWLFLTSLHEPSTSAWRRSALSFVNGAGRVTTGGNLTASRADASAAITNARRRG